MAFLWFGKQKKIEDLKIKDLTKEITKQQIEQQKLVSEQRRAMELYSGYLEAASEPGLIDGELLIAAQKMGIEEKRQLRAQSDLQEVIRNVDVLNSIVSIILRKENLKKSGVWDAIKGVEPGAMEEQLVEIATVKQEDDDALNKIIDILDTSNKVDVTAKMSAEQRRAYEKIKQARKDKSQI